MLEVLTGGAIAVIGGLVGLFGTWLVEERRQRASAMSTHRELLRDACGGFSAVLVRMSHLSWLLEADPTDRELIERIRSAHEEGRTAYERIRLLSDSLAVQRAGRLALRHAFAIWQTAEGKGDPRSHEYTAPPRQRFEEQLQRFYIEVRRELGRERPEDVVPELP